MLTVYDRIRLWGLVVLLAQLVRQPTNSSCVPGTVFAQSLGAVRRLSFRLARRLGVCAHVDFRFPATLISVIPPSVLVSEFLDTMTRGFCPAINRREMPGCVWS